MFKPDNANGSYCRCYLYTYIGFQKCGQPNSFVSFHFIMPSLLSALSVQNKNFISLSRVQTSDLHFIKVFNLTKLPKFRFIVKKALYKPFFCTATLSHKPIFMYSPVLIPNQLIFQVYPCYRVVHTIFMPFQTNFLFSLFRFTQI